MTVLLDTHVVFWWSTEPEKLSQAALATVEASDELAVCGATWFELAWLARRGRIAVRLPVAAWLSELAGELRTVGVSWSVADAAAALPDTFPRDPADRMIYATALINGWPLVTRDGRMHEHDVDRAVTVW